jgi:hypothetical protein
MEQARPDESGLFNVAMVIFTIEGIPIRCVCAPGWLFAIIRPDLVTQVSVDAAFMWAVLFYPLLWACALTLSIIWARRGHFRWAFCATAAPTTVISTVAIWMTGSGVLA